MSKRMMKNSTPQQREEYRRLAAQVEAERSEIEAQGREALLALRLRQLVDETKDTLQDAEREYWTPPERLQTLRKAVEQAEAMQHHP